jgi:hypothetical protein
VTHQDGVRYIDRRLRRHRCRQLSVAIGGVVERLPTRLIPERRLVSDDRT